VALAHLASSETGGDLPSGTAASFVSHLVKCARFDLAIARKAIAERQLLHCNVLHMHIHMHTARLVIHVCDTWNTQGEFIPSIRDGFASFFRRIFFNPLVRLQDIRYARSPSRSGIPRDFIIDADYVSKVNESETRLRQRSIFPHDAVFLLFAIYVLYV